MGIENNGASKGSGVAGIPPNKKTHRTSFVCRIVTASGIEQNMTQKDMMWSKKTSLWLASLLNMGSLSVHITKLQALWVPSVEPTCRALIKMDINYKQLGDSVRDQEGRDVIASAVGVITEQMSIKLYPCRQLILKEGGKVEFPWTVTVTPSGTASRGDIGCIGQLKIWCTMETRRYSSTAGAPGFIFKEPDLIWSHLYFPYYVPFFVFKDPRGVSITDWEKTDEYQEFSTEILPHCPESIKRDKGLQYKLLQTMTLKDFADVSATSKECALTDKAGMFCSCPSSLSTNLINWTMNDPDGPHISYRDNRDFINMVNKGKIGCVSFLGNQRR